jgi:hypothetical protein
MVTSIIPTNILGYWARFVRAGDTTVIQIRPEDVIPLYHYQPDGFQSYSEGMTYRGIRVTQCWKIKCRKNGIHLYSESPEDFIERTKHMPVEEETICNTINGEERIG